MELVWELNFFPLNSRQDFESWKGGYADGRDKYLSVQLDLLERALPPEAAEEMAKAMCFRVFNYPVRRAAAFYKKARFSYSSAGRSFGGQPVDITAFGKMICDLSLRLKDVVVENQSYETFLPHYDRPDGFLYCDPPYFSSEYVYNQDFTWEDHLKLRELLGHIKGKFLLSYNDCPEIRELYRGYEIFDFTRLHSMVQKYTPGREFHELLIGNYDLYERERETASQITINELLGKPIDVRRMIKERYLCKKQKRI